MKKIFSLGLAVLLVMALSVTVFAADGTSHDLTSPVTEEMIYVYEVDGIIIKSSHLFETEEELNLILNVHEMVVSATSEGMARAGYETGWITYTEHSHNYMGPYNMEYRYTTTVTDSRGDWHYKFYRCSEPSPCGAIRAYYYGPF